MSDGCQQFSEDWDLLALDALEEERAVELRAHLSTGCEACRRAFDESLAAARALARSAPDAAPSRRAEQALRARIAPKKARPLPWAWMATAASLVLAAWLAWDRAELQRQLTARPAIREVVIARGPAPLPVPPGQTPASPAVDGQAPAAPAPSAQVPAARVPVEPVAAAERAEIARLTKELDAASEALRAEKAAGEIRQNEANARALRAETALREAAAKELADRRPAASPAVQPAADARLLAELAAAREEIAALRLSSEKQGKQLAEYRRVFRALEGSALRHVDLRSVDPGGGKATARAVYSPDGGLILFARDLPKLPGNKCYQLWIVRKNGPAIVSGGLVQLDAQGRGVLYSGASELLKDATGFAITDEPEGGSVSARGRKLLFGAL